MSEGSCESDALALTCMLFFRRRKVRCDRTYRKCKKCTRRNETCVYPDNTTLYDASAFLGGTWVDLLCSRAVRAWTVAQCVTTFASPSSNPKLVRASYSISSKAISDHVVLCAASLVERLNSNTAATAPHTPPVACPVFFEESFPDLSSSILVALVSGSDSEGACLRLSEYLHECPGLETAPAVAHSHLGRLLVVTLIEGSFFPL